MVRYAPHNFDLTRKFAARAVVAAALTVDGHYFRISIDDDFVDIVDDGDGGDNDGGHLTMHVVDNVVN